MTGSSQVPRNERFFKFFEEVFEEHLGEFRRDGIKMENLPGVFRNGPEYVLSRSQTDPLRGIYYELKFEKLADGVSQPHCYATQHEGHEYRIWHWVDGHKERTSPEEVSRLTADLYESRILEDASR